MKLRLILSFKEQNEQRNFEIVNALTTIFNGFRSKNNSFNIITNIDINKREFIELLLDNYDEIISYEIIEENKRFYCKSCGLELSEVKVNDIQTGWVHANGQIYRHPATPS